MHNTTADQAQAIGHQHHFVKNQWYIEQIDRDTRPRPSSGCVWTGEMFEFGLFSANQANNIVDPI